MKKKFDVYGLGNALMDIQLRVSTSDLELLKLRKGGMQLVDAESQMRIFDFFADKEAHYASGGSAANTIIALAGLGASTAYGCLVADDVFGHRYQSEMQELGILTPNARREGKITGTCLILISEDAERTMNTNLGVSAELDEQDVDEETIQHSSWVYLEGYPLSSDSGSRAALKALQYAKKHGAKVALTLSDAFIVEHFRPALEACLQGTDLVFANHTEACAFAKTTNRDQAFQVLCNQVPNVVMTLGAEGSLIRYQGETHKQAAVTAKAIDLTGAGDMYAGAFLYGISHSSSLQDSAKLASFLAAKVVSTLGPRLNENLRELARSLKIITGDF
ncbi:adenosine kinase [bacterium]|nr:adenosine kinase [bacterium]